MRHLLVQTGVEWWLLKLLATSPQLSFGFASAPLFCVQVDQALPCVLQPHRRSGQLAL